MNNNEQNCRERVLALVTRIVTECPKRQPTSQDEKRATEIIAEEFNQQGLQVERHHFKFNDNLYANIALHFGLGAIASILALWVPLLSFLIHLTVGVSYTADSTRKGYLLRRLLPFKPAQNILGILPASERLRTRIVVGGHVDAAFTGLLFNPKLVQHLSGGQLPNGLGFLRHSMALCTLSMFALAAVDVLLMLVGEHWTLQALLLGFSIPTVLAFAATMEIVIRNQIVPGANDNLSAIAALPELARRLKDKKPGDVELVFLASSCEEASMGGADALARDVEGKWQRSNTVFIALDGLGNGDLCYLNPEGEVIGRPVPSWLKAKVDQTCEKLGCQPVTAFDPPVGGTDAAAFLARGYDAISLVCIDKRFGAPRHYHQLSDTPANLDMDIVVQSIVFTESFIENLINNDAHDPQS